METSNNLSRAEKARVTRKLNAERKARIERGQAEARAVVEGGTCLYCGGGLRRNLSLTGWWQCEQFGAEGFRKDPSKPSCHGQWFTE